MDPRCDVLAVVGTRPNMMKTAPILAELARQPESFTYSLVHTGQHYDREMSEIFLEELGMGEPDFFLDVGSGSHAQQTARVMERLEPVLLEQEPDVVLVPGDVNSTVAAALTAAKLEIPVAHVEAGLRSFDRTMPEELNRVVADQLAELLFTHSPEAEDNLLREGRPAEAIHYVGNTMIDTIVAMLPRIRARGGAATHGLDPGRYLAVTLHRPALVDGALLVEALEHLDRVSTELPVVFPVHPRTRAAMEALGLDGGNERLRLIEPLGYLDFLATVAESAAVLTDSGGIQEEATFLGIPCFTLRDNTERPVTVDLGTNTLLGLEPSRIGDIPGLMQESNGKQVSVPPLWDGEASARIADVLKEFSASLPGRPRAARGRKAGTTR